MTGPWGSVEGLSAWGLQMQFCDVNGPRHTGQHSQAFLSCCLRSFLLLLRIQEALWARFTEDVP